MSKPSNITTRTLLFLILSFFLSPLRAQYITVNVDSLLLLRCDSIVESLKGRTGKELNRGYNIIYDELYAMGDINVHLSYMEKFMDEAIRSNDIENQIEALNKQTKVAYNYSNLELFNDLNGKFLQLTAREGKWEKYFSHRFLECENLIYTMNFDTAMKAANDLYAEAEERNNDYGRAYALSAIGITYKQYDKMQAAEDALLQSCLYFEKLHDNKGLMVNYTDLGIVYRTLKKGEKSLALAHKIEKIAVGEYDRIMVNLVYLTAYTFLGEYQLAEKYLAMVENSAYATTARGMIYDRKIDLYNLQERYDEVLEMIDEVIETAKERGTELLGIQYLADKAAFAYKAGKLEVALDAYKDHYTLSLALKEKETMDKLAALHTQYNLDRHIAEKERNRILAISFAIGALLLALLLIGWMLYSHRLRIKNRALRRRFEEENRIFDELDQLRGNANKRMPASANIAASTATITVPVAPDVDLYRRLRELMRDHRIYTDPDVSRKSVAILLGTNETYLYNALQANLGMSFKDYIRNLRISYAQQLLTEPLQTRLTIIDISMRTGFNSRTTFYRQFRELTGQTPEEYRSGS